MMILSRSLSGIDAYQISIFSGMVCAVWHTTISCGGLLRLLGTAYLKVIVGLASYRYCGDSAGFAAAEIAHDIMR